MTPGSTVALFIPTMGGGGAERVFLALATAFVRLGVDVDLVVVSSKGEFMAQVPPEVRVVNLARARTMFAVNALRSYLARRRPAVLISTLVNANAVALLAASSPRVSTPVVVREAIDAAGQSIHGASLYGRVLDLVRRYLYRRAALVIAPSAGVAQGLVDSFSLDPDRIRVVPNPLDVQAIMEQAAEVHYPLETLGFEGRYVLGMGRLEPQKDFESLLRAFALACPSGRTRLVILGEGGQRPRLESLALELGVGERVVMPGFVANPFPFIREASVFVLSSLFEGSPNALLQAMLLGCPVVSTDCQSGPREILQDGKFGRLVPVGDVKALSMGIEDGLDGRLAHSDAEGVARRHGMEAVARIYLDLLGLCHLADHDFSGA